MTPQEIPTGKLSGAFMVLEECRRELEDKFNSDEILLTEGQINSYQEADKEVKDRLKAISTLVAKFEKLQEFKKTL